MKRRSNFSNSANKKSKPNNSPPLNSSMLNSSNTDSSPSGTSSITENGSSIPYSDDFDLTTEKSVSFYCYLIKYLLGVIICCYVWLMLVNIFDESLKLILINMAL